MSESTGKVTLVHRISITFNKQTGKFEGIPQKVRDTILAAGFTEEQVMDDPSLVKDLLYTLDLEEVLSSSLNISLPSNVEHLVSIKINPETGKLEVNIFLIWYLTVRRGFQISSKMHWRRQDLRKNKSWLIRVWRRISCIRSLWNSY
eukprot:TRINITY_DN944_c0_g1_i9.p1 TRINITY_DN944_c0_g1~~TRINITY_DN944_c0_g1_i9.p1  ORF type:complete len:147 (-),score=11.83 TRINITY_DN944_c0_g1_i9:68-508(-)